MWIGSGEAAPSPLTQTKWRPAALTASCAETRDRRAALLFREEADAVEGIDALCANDTAGGVRSRAADCVQRAEDAET